MTKDAFTFPSDRRGGRKAHQLRALVVRPWYRKTPSQNNVAHFRNHDLKLEEAKNLALAINLEVVADAVFEVTDPNPATFIGRGKVEQFQAIIADKKISIVVFDGPLSPVQQRNLEESFKAQVIDRTGLILEIFGERARTREGSLQVELAHLLYQKSRLVRSWTHLERQRGGFGFLGGPGERQIESDRRQLQERILRIQKELVTVSKRRDLYRKARKRVPFPVIALAGYTNAGKSTLFNTLTGAKVEAVDKLFATLDPTLRSIRLKSGRKVILSDTVGFISDLPTELVAAFRATLEEVCQANLILHVRDISNPETEAQREDVLKVLTSLGIDESEIPIVECLNKVDLLPKEQADAIFSQTKSRAKAVAVSAVSGEGVEELLLKIDDIFSSWEIPVTVTVPAENGAAQAWLYSHTRVVKKNDTKKGVVFKTLMNAKPLGQFKKQFLDCRVVEPEETVSLYA